MKTYARIDNGAVMELIKPMVYEDGTEIPIELRFTAEIVASLVDVTDIDPSPAEWWLYDGKVFSPPAVVAD